MPKRERLQPLQVYRFLPRTNCKECGLSGCMAFAFALISREKTPDDCPPLLTEKFTPSYRFLKEQFGTGEVEETGLMIDRERCNGCGDCVVVSPVLKVVDGVVQVVNWKSCKRMMDPPQFCRVCEEKCPFGALELVR